MLQKEGVNVHEDTARKMRKFKGIEFPRTHKDSGGGAWRDSGTGVLYNRGNGMVQ